MDTLIMLMLIFFIEEKIKEGKIKIKDKENVKP
jgi:hypothetical protein